MKNEELLQEIIKDLNNIKQIVDYRLKQLNGLPTRLEEFGNTNSSSVMAGNLQKEIEEKRQEIMKQAEKVRQEAMASISSIPSINTNVPHIPTNLHIPNRPFMPNMPMNTNMMPIDKKENKDG
jgi:hypothetical protein